MTAEGPIRPGPGDPPSQMSTRGRVGARDSTPAAGMTEVRGKIGPGGLAIQGDTCLLNARIPAACAPQGLPQAGDGLVAADLTISGGCVRYGRTNASEVDLAGAMVWPCTIDAHTHIDKGQVWARSPNTDGSFHAAMEVAPRDAENSDGEDMRTRAGFILGAAYAHGTKALRSHVDGAPERLDRNLGILSELAQDWAGRIDLQLCPFTGIGEDPAWIDTLAAWAADTPGQTLSLFLFSHPDLDPFLDRAIALADRYGLGLDFHADENLDPTSHCLDAIARAVLRTGFGGPVLVGHCCALSVQPQATMDATLNRVARAGLGIVSLPLCNAYLMGRAPATTPRHRGIAPVHEMRAHGIPVAIGSDNVRDAFYAYGDMDAVDLFRDAMRWMHLDHPVSDWPACVTATAADVIGRPDLGRIMDGDPADLIILSARNWSEFAARPANRTVLRNGVAIDTTPPDFTELDHLKGMRP